VARRQQHLQPRAPKLHGPSVLEPPLYLHSRKVALRTERRIAASAILDHPCIALRRVHLRSGHFRNLRKTGYVVVVCLHRQQDLDVAELEPHLLNTLADLRH